jgi:hypothetical protein
MISVAHTTTFQSAEGSTSFKRHRLHFIISTLLQRVKIKSRNVNVTGGFSFGNGQGCTNGAEIPEAIVARAANFFFYVSAKYLWIPGSDLASRHPAVDDNFKKIFFFGGKNL